MENISMDKVRMHKDSSQKVPLQADCPRGEVHFKTVRTGPLETNQGYDPIRHRDRQI